MSHLYAVRFTVAAETYLEAVARAVAKLRTGLKLVAVISVDRTTAPYWVVRLQVAEDS